MQKLPVGIQSFSNLREDNYLYIDKTEFIFRLLHLGKPFFLSRPRRFGKSLMISTIESVFKGRKDLFKGLYIEDKWDWTQQFPVIRLDFGAYSSNTSTELTTSLTHALASVAKNYQLSLPDDAPLPYRFKELIEQLHEKTGKKVVILVDEYDKPIIDHLSCPEIAENIRTTLSGFYQVLKVTDDHLRFVFLTGVSKFSKISIFSGLNNLNDITMDVNFTTICGYTQEELENYFSDYIQAMADHHQCSVPDLLTKIRHWYNGYSWDGKTSVYNPFSTLLLFSKKEFCDYWFETGTPTFLVNLMKQRNDASLFFQPSTILLSGFNSFDYSNLNTQLLLFQTGYITIKQVHRDEEGDLIYTLGVPNEEVRQSMISHLISCYADYPVPDAAP
jgi:hypothetical protein